MVMSLLALSPAWSAAMVALSTVLRLVLAQGIWPLMASSENPMRITARGRICPLALPYCVCYGRATTQQGQARERRTATLPKHTSVGGRPANAPWQLKAVCAQHKGAFPGTPMALLSCCLTCAQISIATAPLTLGAVIHVHVDEGLAVPQHAAQRGARPHQPHRADYRSMKDPLYQLQRIPLWDVYPPAGSSTR